MSCEQSRMANKKPLHVVILPYLAQGTLIPALMLAHKLATVGFDVSYVILEHRLQHVKNHAMIRGCHQRIRLTCLKLNEEPPVDVHHNSMGHDSFALLRWLRFHGDAERDELVKLLTSFKSSEDGEEDASLPGPPACIISAGTKSWTQDVANELGIPRLVLFPGPVEALLMDLYVKVLHPQGQIPIRSSLLKENQITPDELEPLRLPGMPPIHPDDINSVLQDCCPKAITDYYVGTALRHHEAAGILCNSFMELEPGACSAMQNSEINPNSVPFLPVGPLLADSYFAEGAARSNDEECLEWLDKQPASSVLYVSFGSLARPSAEQVGELAFGLEASNQPFLWVLRPPDDESSGLEDLPKGFLSRVGDRCLVTQKFAPQLAVLSHRATGGFLTHSGWNSTLESVSLGVPMISLPFFGDQRTNCRMVVDRLKLGLELRKDGNGVARKEEVERAVKALMDSEEGEAIKIRVQEFRTLATQAFESSHSQLKSFIEQVTSV